MSEDSEKPFGWRPYSAEHRQNLRDMRMSEEAIDAQELTNVYAPVESAIVAQYTGRALLWTLTKRFGPDFAKEFLVSLEGRVAADEASDMVEDNVEAVIGRKFLTQIDWSPLMVSSEQPDAEKPA